jgi:hypothetical protein
MFGVAVARNLQEAMIASSGDVDEIKIANDRSLDL